MKRIAELSDEELVSLYVTGNNSAFDALLRRHQDRVFSYVFSIVKSQELAEDIFQDIFMKIVVRIKEGQYLENGKFSSWMMRLVRNHMIDYFRTCPPKIIVSNDASAVDLFNNAAVLSGENREVEMINQQTLREVKALIEMLPDNQREVLLMRFEEELSFKEIAEKKKISINTALGRMRYALINLRKMAVERGFHVAS